MNSASWSKLRIGRIALAGLKQPTLRIDRTFDVTNFNHSREGITRRVPFATHPDE
jgi:hypothetical protein